MIRKDGEGFSVSRIYEQAVPYQVASAETHKRAVALAVEDITQRVETVDGLTRAALLLLEERRGHSDRERVVRAQVATVAKLLDSVYRDLLELRCCT